MNYALLRSRPEYLLMECVSGSHAYGLQIATSDIDLRGVFLLPKTAFYGFGYVEQVGNPTHDEVYYELKRYVELLAKNNPNLLELLATPPDCIRYRHPLLERFTPELFLSKRCEDAFAGYAQAQIRKARGLNKKILRPVDPVRKSILEFCHVAAGQGSIPLAEWLDRHGYRQEDCGLAAIPHFRDGYALFHAEAGHLRGILSGPGAQEVCLSSIPKSLSPLAVLHFNKDGYAMHCREYHEYWEWVEKRNDARYQGTLAHGKNYDAKNMMHTFRLLRMALEIAREGEVRVRRPDREFLLAIRRGEFGYEELVARADAMLPEIRAAYAASSLRDLPDMEKAEEILVEIRDALYRAQG